jgi:hypothetical protein
MPEITMAAEGVGFGWGVGAELPADAELPVLTLVVEPVAALFAETVEPAENGFAPPDPQPTTEATATSATPNLINTFDNECNLSPRYELQLAETTVGFHLLWLYRRRAVGEVAKIPRLF